MKTFLLSFIAVLLSSITVTVFADTAVVEVPITVGDDNTYTVTTEPPSSGDYYYVYSGHRCYTTEQTSYKVKGTMITSTTKPSLYCYPYP